MSLQPAAAADRPAPANPPAPDYRITVDGQDISAKVRPRLIELTITDNPGFEADQLDLALDDSDGKLTIPPRGAVISVALGWKGEGLTDKGTFTVDDVEHTGAPDRLTIRARSADLRASLTAKREQSWHATTVGAILRTIAERNKLDPVIAEILAERAIAHLDQTDESDANLLTRMARDFDAIATVKSGRLVMLPTGRGVTASGKVLMPVTITRQSGDQHRFSAADRGAYTGVRAYWHDTRSGQKDSVLVGNDDQPEEPDTTEPSAGSIKALRHTYASKANAARAAKSEWQRLQRAVAQFTITLAHGNPALIPELPVLVRGWKPEIDGADWIIQRPTHRLTPDSLTTVLELQIRTPD